SGSSRGCGNSIVSPTSSTLTAVRRTDSSLSPNTDRHTSFRAAPGSRAAKAVVAANLTFDWKCVCDIFSRTLAVARFPICWAREQRKMCPEADFCTLAEMRPEFVSNKYWSVLETWGGLAIRLTEIEHS